ncbi:EAL domain-containing protein [Acuticoccus sp. MNP-M23]|uniref:EAL domain-containing protein n=1 Tax=Acuticoccus sp. MNP-M23 TaxID=3072793 RepID=UPI002815AEB5|nr:EAL domain-containing protein [Acuticoccus sp. MNP-M23]WMS42260.1 EAL domain-containing protein [Acuticoccus sp. MNP-M23]
MAVLISWMLALHAQREGVERTAIGAAKVADSIYADAERVLSEIEATDTTPCSPENIEQMFDLHLRFLRVDNIAYGLGDNITCTAFGAKNVKDAFGPPDWVQPDGLTVNVNWEGGLVDQLSGRGPILVMRRGGYDVLIDQRQLYDDLYWTEWPMTFTVSTQNGLPLYPTESREGGDLRTAGDGVAVELHSKFWIVTARAERITIGAHLSARKSTLTLLVAAIMLPFASGGYWLLLRRRSLDSELSTAIRQGELFVEYQPIVSLSSRTCVGAEALVRWRRPDGQIVRPDVFIPIAEDTGIAGQITDLVIKTTVKELAGFLQQERSFYVSINASAGEISSGQILTALQRGLKGSTVDPAQICIEATERSFVEIEGAAATIAELRRRGHRAAIDDFGTGYSSLRYLQDLPMDTLKIDKAFIDTIGTGAVTRSVTGHIIRLAKCLDLNLVAEGVETEVQAAFLRKEGVHAAQGWLFARPLPCAEFIDFCRKHRTDAAETALPAA